jgi:hypothetical protein
MRMDVYKREDHFLQKLEGSYWMMDDARKYKECGFCRIHKLKYKTNHYTKGFARSSPRSVLLAFS